MIRRVLFILLMLGLGITSDAQIESALIGINGLTCSQCTRNVELQLRKLPFVADVSMNLEHTSGVIHTKTNARISPEAIAKAVKDAGFSLRYLKIRVHRTDTDMQNGTCFSVAGLSFQPVSGTENISSDIVSLQILGVPFQPKKEVHEAFKRACTGSKKVYFVAISND